MDGWVASGKPCSPSTTAMRRSLKPRLRNSLRPSASIWRPRSVRSTGPALLSNHPRPCLRKRYGLVFDTPFLPNLKPQRIKRQWETSLQAARLPLFHFSQHFIGEGRNEIRRDFKSVQLEQMPANLAHAHLTCIHADHMILKARQAPLIFGNERRLKRGKPVSRNIQRSITRRRDHGLRAAAVAVIVGFPLRVLLL